MDSVNYVRIVVLSGRTQIGAIAAVPEPATAGLAMLAVTIMGLSRKRPKH